MSSFDKVVKLACKPKAAPPKAKYLDPIIAATWSDDGAVHDVCKALFPRFREPNSIVVFKALIVLHTMIRNGSTDNVLSHLSSNEVLRLKNVSSTDWDGYTAPQNLQHYAIYLDSRIRAYAELKHDAIHVQSESNRDMRNSLSIEEDKIRTLHTSKSSPGPMRSKTMMGRKLRLMTVEKGLLRETKVVHKMIDALVECRFYLDDLEDELTITALRMLVKDLLILFQAGNEGVINLLEHYFEMSHHDAKDALAIYRRFCKQTERVVEYLGVAKKLQNLLNVPIPNLKHAPVSLAGSLQEYLDDPNFEQNRIEYKANKAAVDKSAKKGNASTTTLKEDKASASKNSTIKASSTSNTTEKPEPTAEKDVIDFFSSIEEQTTIINPATAFPNAGPFDAQGIVNPFMQRQMVTVQPFVQTQMTGFPVFQQPTGAPNPFALAVQEAPQQQASQYGGGHRPFSSYLPAQATGMFTLQQQPQQPQQTGFLQPQAMGVNPFRQSMLVPQQTATPAFPAFGANTFGSDTAIQNAGMNAFSTTPQPQGPFATLPGNVQAQNPFPSLPNAQNTQTPPFAQTNSGSTPSSFASSSNNQGPARPASTPLGPSSNSITPPFVKTHQTGSKNPFGRVVTPPPVPAPRQPTMMELAMGFGQQQQQQQPQPANDAFQTQLQNQTPTAAAFTSPTNGANPISFNTGALAVGGTNMSSVASSFAFSAKSSTTTTTSTPTASALNPQTTASTTTGSALSDSIFSSMASQPTATPNSAASPTLRPQATGFAPLKAFKPSSSFGASLMESLPPVPTIASSNSTSSTGLDTPTTTTGSLLTPLSGFSALNSQPTGFKSSVGVGLRPQMTGNVANPFRASMAVGGGAGATGAFGSSAFGQQPVPPPVPSGAFSGFGSSGAFGVSPSTGQNLFGALNAGTPAGANNPQQLGSAQQASLI